MFGLKQFALVQEISLYARHVVRLAHVRHVQRAHLVARHDLAHVIRHHEHQPVRHVGKANNMVSVKAYLQNKYKLL